jgi:hypothetical protein
MTPCLRLYCNAHVFELQRSSTSPKDNLLPFSPKVEHRILYAWFNDAQSRLECRKSEVDNNDHQLNIFVLNPPGGLTCGLQKREGDREGSAEESMREAALAYSPIPYTVRFTLNGPVDICLNWQTLTFSVFSNICYN